MMTNDVFLWRIIFLEFSSDFPKRKFFRNCKNFGNLFSENKLCFFRPFPPSLKFNQQIETNLICWRWIFLPGQVYCNLLRITEFVNLSFPKRKSTARKLWSSIWYPNVLWTRYTHTLLDKFFRTIPGFRII